MPRCGMGKMMTYPMPMAEEPLANNIEDVNRYFHYFRAQDYEVIIRENVTGKLSLRDPKIAMIRADEHKGVGKEKG